MRTVPLEICGESIEMPVSFTAGEKLERAGYDPLKTALRTNRGEQTMTSQGVITVLHIGAREAGSKLKREQIGQAVFDDGVMKWLGKAVDYMAAFVTAGPEHPVPEVAGAKNDEAE